MKNVLFDERQTLGSVRFWTSWRFAVVLFCVAAYFVSEERNRSEEGDLFLVVGTGVMLISILFIFLTHYRTIVQNGSLILTGLWSTKKVKLDFQSIDSCEIVKYSPFFINNPVYNFHKKGTIRFYAHGKYAVKLIDKDGLVYIIGSQDPIELDRVIKEMLKANK